PNEGMPAGAVVDIEQDQNGFMWFASVSGLVRYDSHRFKAYKHSAKDPSSLPANYVRDIAIDKENNIWASTTHGISYFDSKTETFQNFLIKDFPEKSPLHTSAYTVCIDRTNRVWITTPEGVFEIRKNKETISVSPNVLGRIGNGTFHARNMSEDPQGVLWVSADEGLLRVNKDGSNGKLFVPASDVNEDYKGRMQSVFADKKNNIWVGSAKNGLYLFDKSSGNFNPVLSVGESVGNLSTQVYYITQDKQGFLWIATLNGLVQLDPETLKAKAFRHQKNNPGSLPDDGLISIYCDKENGLWIGSYYIGLAYTTVSALAFQAWPVPWTDSRAIDYGLSWIGTTIQEKQLWLIPDSKKEVLFLREPSNQLINKKLPLPLPNGYDTFQAVDENTVWCAASSLLSKLDLTSGRRKDFPFPVEEGKPVGGRTRFIAASQTNRYWIGGDFGLFQFDETTGIFQRMSGVSSVYCYYVDAQNNTWFGGTKGDLYVARRSDQNRVEKHALTSDDPAISLTQIWRLTGDPSGRIWLAIGENPFLLEVNRRTFKLTPLPTEKLSGNDFPYDVQRDSKGYLWIAADGRLLRFHPDLKTTQLYSSRDGLPIDGTPRPMGSAHTAGGSFFFGTSEGLVRFNPSDFQTWTKASPLVITSDSPTMK
ncbi:MAG: hypothetical protein J7576_13095, partial [Siphonobacter aquaeclarae]|nr:hypothetical protein [Siphonobacter aquaeclarae]